MLIAFMILWIPYVRLTGFVLIVAAVIVLVKGRSEFGKEHSRNVILALVLLLISLTGEVLVTFYFYTTLDLFSGKAVNYAYSAAFVTAIYLFLSLSVIFGVIWGVVFVLPMVNIDNRSRQDSLWVALGFWILITLWNETPFYGPPNGSFLNAGISGLIGAILASAAHHGSSGLYIQPYGSIFSIATVIPCSLFALSYYKEIKSLRGV